MLIYGQLYANYIFHTKNCLQLFFIFQYLFMELKDH